MVTNDVIKTALIGFVDAQTDWTKQVIKTSTSTATTIMGETVKALQEAAKFDYAKFGEGVMKAYNQMHRSV
jgi:hypothetical protein